MFAAAEGSALSPTLRKCCMDCPGGDLVIVQEPLRERRSSRGDANSDSSSTSKDGSIQVRVLVQQGGCFQFYLETCAAFQSDTSLDSEDSCVSVIFVPHPELEHQPPPPQGQVTTAAPNVAELVLAKQRSTSNSSESSSGDSGTHPDRHCKLKLRWVRVRSF